MGADGELYLSEKGGKMKRTFLAMVAVVFAFIPQAYAQEYQEITEVPPNVIKDIEVGFYELGIPYIPAGLPEVTLTPEEIAALPPEQRELIAEYKELKDLLTKEVESKLLDARIEELQKEIAALPGRKPRWDLIGASLVAVIELVMILRMRRKARKI